jgi:diguanylate cyclase (GGDEF)-like protein
MTAEEPSPLGDPLSPSILVIDDNPVKRLAIRAMLGPLGYSIVEADSGRAAMRCVEAETFATILVDVRMPIMDGYETVKLIREHSVGALTPVIFVTAFRPDEIETDLAHGNGAIEFLFTPVLPDVLRAKVSAFVDLFSQSQEKQRSLDSALERRTLYDDLTGVANRTLFSDLVTRELASARRNDERRALLVMNLDGFRQVNDAIGHDRGDALLRGVGERLTAALREADTVARLDGDAFAVMPADTRDLAAAAEVAWKIQRACESEFVVGEETVHVSASIGIALFPEHGRTTAELLRCAEMAMYVAKRTGNGHAVFDAAHERKTADHLALLLDLRECVERDQLVLHYQPKIDLSTREIFGVEALVRWRHPTQGLLQPGSFMPDVERTDLIEPVTRWVLETALSQQRRWRDEGYDLSMAVNVSARSLEHGSALPELVAELTSTSEIPPGRLTLELTEGALIEATAPDVLARLHDMGQRVSIDDFGTGYSSLVYLQRLAADEIKVDRSFVTTIATTGDDAIIVRSTIDLAHNLGLTVVAEGVEDQNVLDALVGYGCDAAQGFHFARPAPAEELTEWLSESPYGLPAAA